MNHIIRISIIEDSEIHREWLNAEISNNSRFSVVSVDRFGRKGMESVKKFNPSLVLLDFQLEDITGLEVAKRIKTFSENIKIFVITAHTEISIIERLIDDSNVDAIAVKGSRYFQDNFLTAIFEVANSGTYIDPSLLGKLRESNKLNDISELTKREFEIFIQSAAGKTDNKIAEDLCVELAHIKNIKSKISKKIRNNSNSRGLLLKLLQNAAPDKQEVEH